MFFFSLQCLGEIPNWGKVPHFPMEGRFQIFLVFSCEMFHFKLLPFVRNCAGLVDWSAVQHSLSLSSDFEHMARSRQIQRNLQLILLA